MASNRKSGLKIEVSARGVAPRSFTSVARAKAYADRATPAGKRVSVRITN